MSNSTIFLSDLEPLYNLRREADNKQRQYRENADNQCHQLSNALSSLEEFTRDLLDLGIVVIRKNHLAVARQLNVDLPTYCKKIQKQLKRPLLIMTQRDEGRIMGVRIWDHWELVMPTALMDLAAPLLIVSKNLNDIPDEEHRYSMDGLGCMFHTFTGKGDKHWRFVFITDVENNKAEEIRTGWLEFCRSDNLCRMHLNMPFNEVDMSIYRDR